MSERPTCACGAEIDRPSVPWVLVRPGLARCVSCGAVVSRRGDWTVLPRHDAGEPRAVGRWVVQRDGETLVLRRRWLSAIVVPLIALTLMWDVLVWQVTMVARPLTALLMPHAWVALAMTYGCLWMLLNTTRVRANTRSLTVHGSPLPSLEWSTLDRAEVQELVAVERYGRKGAVLHTIFVARPDGRFTSLVTCTDESQVVHLRAWIEKAMGIVPVKEIDRGGQSPNDEP